MSSVRVLFSTGSLYPLDIADCFDLAAEAGFDGMEIMCDERWSTRSPDYLAGQTARTGLPVLVAHTPFSFRVPGWQASTQLDLIEHSVALAETLHAESVVVHLPQRVGHVFVVGWGINTLLPWRNPFKPVKEWMADGGLARRQEQTAVKLCIENMPKRLVAGRRRNVTYWNTVAEWPAVHRYLTLDTTHWATHDIDPLDAYRAADGRVAHVHLSNFDGKEHRLPHKGQIDLGAFLRALTEDDFSGTVTLELHPESLEFSDRAALTRNLAESVAFTRQHLNGRG